MVSTKISSKYWGLDWCTYRKGILMKKYKKDDTYILKFFKEKVTAVRRKIQVWVVWDDEDERDGWRKVFTINWNKQVDGGWQKEPTYKIVNLKSIV